MKCACVLACTRPLGWGGGRAASARQPRLENLPSCTWLLVPTAVAAEARHGHTGARHRGQKHAFLVPPPPQASGNGHKKDVSLGSPRGQTRVFLELPQSQASGRGCKNDVGLGPPWGVSEGGQTLAFLVPPPPPSSGKRMQHKDVSFGPPRGEKLTFHVLPPLQASANGREKHFSLDPAFV